AAQCAVQFPAPSALAGSFDRELVADVAEAIAEQCRAAGVGLLVGPSLALQRDAACGDNFMRFSEDPLLAGSLAAAFTEGLRKGGVLCCLTDFGVSASVNDRAATDVLADKQTLQDIWFEAARTAFAAAPAAVMCSESKLGGCASAQHEWLLGRVLREQLGFEGAVFQPVGGADDAAAAVAAGAPLRLAGGGAAAKQLENALQSEQLTHAQLDAAAEQALNLLQDAQASALQPMPCNMEKHRALARRAARECMVLLKNDGGVLPFAEGGDIAVIGAFAEAQPQNAFGVLQPKPYKQTSLLSAFAEAGQSYIYAAGYNPDGSSNSTLISEAKLALQQAGRGILVLGLPQGEESALYDREHLRLPDGMLKLADTLSAENLPLAVVLFTAGPVLLPFESRVPALLYSGAAGEAAGEAAADILLGRANPTGRLAQSWPRTAAQLPAAGEQPARTLPLAEDTCLGYRGFDAADVSPLYRFGHGLSYASLVFEQAEMDRSSVMGERQKITVSCRVSNPTERVLNATLQLYAGLRGDSLQTLAAFGKVRLLPGQTEIAELALHADCFSQYDPVQDRRRLASGSRSISLDDVKNGKRVTRAQFVLQVSARDGYVAPPRVPASELPANDGSCAKFAAPAADTQHFGLHSTLQQLKTTLAGRAMFEELSLLVEESAHPNKAAYLAALLRLPVRLLPAYTLGLLPQKRIERLLEFANRHYFRGIIHALRK
ncbi:MAG: glycoside hydrolase family 3 C-terminal domain-containing protein, partial [Oscillospiraceae bacterium]|nr:glycoside hydrolase family 3 C-terminal domain-containing protein [Oscillospiraceae bacterium]